MQHGIAESNPAPEGPQFLTPGGPSADLRSTQAQSPPAHPFAAAAIATLWNDASAGDAADPASPEADRLPAATLHRLFEWQAARTPQAIAVSLGVEHLTYDELNRRANRLAHRLRRAGVRSGALVGLYTGRCLETIVGILGILKAGAAYVPIDAAYPPERIAFLVEDARISLLLTLEELSPAVSGPQARLLFLDADQEELAQDSPADLNLAVDPSDVAYVIYTSGSTGLPKGCLVSHHNVVRLMRSTDPWFRFQPTDVVTLFHSHAFDFSVWEIWSALLFGARLVVVPYDVSRNPALFLQLVHDERVTVLNQTPSAFREFQRADSATPLPLSLRLILFGGEALDFSTLRPWFERHSDTQPQLVNLYGITETTVHVTYRPLRRDDALAGSGSLIGEPIPDLSLYLLDPAGNPVPNGEPGEIVVGGEGVSLGYLHRPELTAQRFVPDPFRASPGARMYRSGDLARRLPNGELEYLGRIDDQIKLRGFRIELGEIAARIRLLDGIADCLVVVDGKDEEARILAYLVLDGPRPSAAALRAALAAQMPDYMLPAAFVVIPAIPLTTHGKADRRALPAPDASNLLHDGGRIPPRTRLEQELAAIWTELLGLPEVGVTDDFFSLGGHSLTAMRVSVRLRSRLGVELPVSRLFEHPTLAALAPVVDAACVAQGMDPAELARLRGPAGPPASTPASAVPLPQHPAIQHPAIQPGRLPVPAQAVLPAEGQPTASFGQEILWAMEQLLSDTAQYNEGFGLEFHGPLHEDALRSALLALLERHEALRGRYGKDAEGRLVLRIAPPGELDFTLLDLSAHSPAEALDLQQRAEREEANRRFDLATGPLFRAVLYRLSPELHRLQLTMHHVAVDGWSTGVIFRDLEALYNAAVAGQPPALPPLALSVSAYARRQRESLAGPEGDRLLAYWKQQLAGAPFALQLPTDRPRPPRQTFRGLVRPYALRPELASALRAFCLREQVTPFMVSLAVYFLVLRSYTGQDDIVIGSPVAARSEVETENLVGYLTNTVLLRCQASPAATFRDLLRQVRSTALDAYAHQQMPLVRLIQELSTGRDASRAALFQTMLVYQNAPPHELAFHGLQASARDIRADAAKLDLILELVPHHDARSDAHSDSLSALIEFNTDLFDIATVDRLWEHFTTCLERALAEPATPLHSLSPLPEAERRLLLHDWNQTRADYPRQTPLAALIEEQADRTPNAIAVSDEHRRLTYRELNERANQLAHELRAQGVAAGDLVGLFVHRSTEMLMALLAIVKAGAAYLPLDPTLPEDRLRYMLDDSGLRFLVTERRLVIKVADFRGATVLLDHDAWATRRRTNPSVPVTPDHLAYVLYTSGSTGRPKGVQVPRGALTNLLWAMRSQLEITAQDRILAVTTISFDIAGMDMWLPLLTGAEVVIASREVALDAILLRSLLAEQRITTMQATPVTWQMLLEVGWQGSPSLQAICTGEAMPPELAAQLAPRVRRTWNLYGPTETTIWSTGFEITDPTQPVLIGRPIANTQCFLLDAALQPVPLGATGELYLGGDGLALGYLGRPELTAERFVPNPFGPPGSRLYRTGDLARYRPDGNIECLGRIDHQVKIRGYRIELGEIEAALEEQPEIERAVVVARAAGSGEKRLVAFLARPQSQPALDPAELRRRLRAFLPNYMTPAAFHYLPALPLNANGKIDRNALVEPSAPSAAGPSSAAATPLQEELLRLWAETLDLPHVGLDGDFFELGGNSLQAVRLLTRIRAAFPQAEPTFADILNAPSVEQFTRVLESAALPRSCVVPVRTGGTRPAFFCAHGAGGNVLSLRELFFALPEDQPIYCLEARGQDGRESPFTSVEQSADFYVREMLRLQPEGPYHVGGECYGGLIAFEIARRLRILGKQVGVVVLIDTENHTFGRLLPLPTWIFRNTRFFLRRMKHHARALSRMKPEDGRGYFLGRLAAFRRRLRRSYFRRPTALPPQDLSAAARERVRAASIAAAAAYRPAPYDGPLLVFSAALRDDDPYGDDALGWRPLARGGVTAIEVEADHLSITRAPIVHTIARHLDEALRKPTPR